LNEKRKLDNLRDAKIKGILLRSKAEWIEGSENNTAFCKFIKRGYPKKMSNFLEIKKVNC